jgi:hypothetical protein
MINKLKRDLGYIGRGLLGYFEYHYDTPPDVPAELKSFTIGTSVLGSPIECYKIGTGDNKLLYACGIHGNEIGTVKLAYYFLKWASSHIFNNYTLFIIPCLNPDGYQLACKHPDYFRGGVLGRFNANHVDLNRNFDTPSFKKESLWSFGREYLESVEVYCGEYGNSEPEVRALTDLIVRENISTLFMYHNAGRDVMGNNNERSETMVRRYAELTGFRRVSNNEWERLKQTGTAKEWCEHHSVAYVEIEGSTRWGSDWKTQREAIESIVLAHNV